MAVQKTLLANGAEGLFIENSRFNTTLVSFNFYLPLEREKAAAYALLPFILTSCSKAYPDFSKLNFKLSKLYGARLSAHSEKSGDYQVLKMAVSVIGDRYSLDGETLTSEAIDLLTGLIFEPNVEDGAFLPADAEREKRKAIEHIKGEFAEKRIYAKNRLIEEMYKDSVYGTPKCGTVEDVEKLDGKALFEAWQDMLKTGYIRVNVVSSSVPNRLFDSLSEKLTSLNRTDVIDIGKTELTLPAEKVNKITEKSPVNQGKLVMGFSAEGLNDKNKAVLLVTSDIFGGGPYSKLFTNVREKMSLCYYCSARSIRAKGLVTVESGVESRNAEKALNAITEQLNYLQKGILSDEEFNSSIIGLTDTLNSYNDSQAAIESWYATRIFDDEVLSPEDYAAELKKITKEDVIDTAKGIKLHTVFLLLPEEEKK